MGKTLDNRGSVSLDITVPNCSKAPLVLTILALGFAGGTRIPVGGNGTPQHA